MKRYCRICLAMDVRFLKLGDTDQSSFIEYLFIQKGYYRLLNKNHDICLICNSLLTKTYQFILRALKAQQVFEDLMKHNTLMASVEKMNDIDRHELKLNYTNLSFKNLDSVSINEYNSAISIKRQIDDATNNVINYDGSHHDYNTNLNSTNTSKKEIKLGQNTDFPADVTDTNLSFDIIRDSDGILRIIKKEYGNNAALGNLTHEHSRQGNLTQENDRQDNLTQENDRQGNLTQDNDRQGNFVHKNSRQGKLTKDDTRQGNLSQETDTQGKLTQDDTRQVNLSQETDTQGNLTQEINRHDIFTKDYGNDPLDIITRGNPHCIDITEENDELNESISEDLIDSDNQELLDNHRAYESVSTHKQNNKRRTQSEPIIIDSDCENTANEIEMTSKQNIQNGDKECLDMENKSQQVLLKTNNKVIKQKNELSNWTIAMDVDSRNIVDGKRKRKMATVERYNNSENYLPLNHNCEPDYDYVPDSSESESTESESEETDRGITYPRTCENCDALLSSRLEHFHHYLEIHPKIPYPHKKSKFLYICEICGLRINYRSHVKRHMMTHGERTVPCKQCSKMFFNIDHLYQHVTRVHRERKFVCDYCEKRFPGKGAIRLHIRTHTGDKPYKCHICRAGFAHNGNRLLHIRVKHQNLPYPQQEKRAIEYQEKLNKMKQKRRRRKQKMKCTSSDDDETLATVSKRKKKKKRKSKTCISDSEL